MLVSASYDYTIKIWDLKLYQEIRTFKGHECRVSCVTVSDDEKSIISGDDKGSVWLWCLHTGKLLSCFEAHSSRIR
jgi:WD40 repeat protein